MSKVRSSQKKVTLSELNNHEINNKRQVLKDLKMLNFDELEYRNTAQKRFYETVSKKDITFCIGPAGCGKTFLSVHRALKELGDINLWVNNKSYNFVENIHQIWLLAITDLVIGKREYSA